MWTASTIMSKPGPRRPAKSSSTRKKGTAAADDDESTDRTQSRSAVATGAGTSRTEAEPKDETGSNGDKKDGKTPDDPPAAPEPKKPQSAGATIRDAGQKLLGLTMKQEWTSIDPVLKQLEKIMAAGGGEHNLAPLLGVADPVSIFFK